MTIIKTRPNDTECPECGGMVASDKGETYCRSCGIVINDSEINYQTEWDPSNRTEEKNRGTFKDTETTHDKSLGSQISYKNKDSRGRSISSDKRQQLSRLRNWQNAYQFSSDERRLRKGLAEVHRLVSAMDLDNEIAETSSKLLKETQKENIILGRSIDGMADASVFIASRMLGTTRPMNDWGTYTTVDVKKLRTHISVMQKELDIGYEATVPLDYVDEISDEFDLKDEKRYKVRELVKEGQGQNLHVGKRPRPFVGGAVYIVANWVTQEEVADKLDVAPKTVRERYKDLEDIAQDLS